jgi:predicted transglutaminase-like cysteine proteinase
MRILAALALCFTAAAVSLPGQASADPFPAHVSEFQPAKAPEGARNLCRNYPWACGSAAAAVALADGGQMHRVASEINLAVNRQVRPERDSANYGTAEKWTLPAGNRGDCEDYALLKKKLLIERGVPADRLLLTVVVGRTREPHLVLLFRGDDADYLLDNMTDAMLPWRSTGYTVVKMQSAADQTAWSAVLLGPLATRKTADARVASAAAREEVQVADNAAPEVVENSLVSGRRHF